MFDREFKSSSNIETNIGLYDELKNKMDNITKIVMAKNFKNEEIRNAFVPLKAEFDAISLIRFSQLFSKKKILLYFEELNGNFLKNYQNAISKNEDDSDYDDIFSEATLQKFAENNNEMEDNGDIELDQSENKSQCYAALEKASLYNDEIDKKNDESKSNASPKTNASSNSPRDQESSDITYINLDQIVIELEEQRKTLEKISLAVDKIKSDLENSAVKLVTVTISQSPISNHKSVMFKPRVDSVVANNTSPRQEQQYTTSELQF